MIYFGWNCGETSKPQTVENDLRHSCFAEPVHLTYQCIARISRAILGKVKQMMGFAMAIHGKGKKRTGGLKSFKEFQIVVNFIIGRSAKTCQGWK